MDFSALFRVHTREWYSVDFGFKFESRVQFFFLVAWSLILNLTFDFFDLCLVGNGIFIAQGTMKV